MKQFKYIEKQIPNESIPKFNKDTCAFLNDLMIELASVTGKGLSLTFSTVIGNVTFNIA